MEEIKIKSPEELLEDYKKLNRHERRRLGKLLGIKIVGVNKPNIGKQNGGNN